MTRFMTSFETIAVASHLDQGLSLCREHDLHRLLVGERAVLVTVVLDLAGPGREAAYSVLVQSPHPLDRLVACPLLLLELSSRSIAALEATSRARISSVSSLPSLVDAEGRISAGRVRPWTTRVKKITENVRKMIRSRLGNDLPIVVERDRKRGGQRDRPRMPLHAITSRARRWSPGTLALAAIERADHVGHGHDPDDPRADHHAAGRHRIAGQVAAGVAPERVDHRAKLEADEHEESGVDQEVEDVPDRRVPAAACGRR